MKINELISEAAAPQKPMKLTAAVNKLLKPAVAKRLGCEPAELVMIRSPEYGDVSSAMEKQHEALDALDARNSKDVGKSIDLPFMLVDPDMDPEDAEEVSFDIHFMKHANITFAAFGLQEGGPSYSAQFLVKRSDLKALVASATAAMDD